LPDTKCENPNRPSALLIQPWAAEEYFYSYEDSVWTKIFYALLIQPWAAEEYFYSYEDSVRTKILYAFEKIFCLGIFI